jgi:polyisoprenoid-binding protein YceI
MLLAYSDGKFIVPRARQAYDAELEAQIGIRMKSVAQLQLVLGLTALAAASVSAQNAKWQIDAGHSTASVFLAQSGDPDPGLNIAVAMAAGTVDLDSADPSKLSLQLNIIPADQDQALLNSNGTLRAGAYAALSRYTVISFQSESAVRDQSGKLQLTGNVTVTYVEREAPADWNVGYSGPTVVTPGSESATRKFTFTFDKSASDIAYGQKVGWMEITGLGKIPLEDFPTLRHWLWSSVWPMLVEDRSCYGPNYSISMREYHGAVCTGQLVETKPPKEVPYSSGSGLDYSGPRFETPQKINEVRILLDLKMREPH